jgi:putative peptidoglycan lipid II flippase
MTGSSRSSFSLASVGRSAAFLAGATASAQVVGLVRELYLALQLGVSARLDAVIVGIALPVVLSTMLTAGTHAALVPPYLDARESSEPARAGRLAGVVLVWAAIAGAVLTLLLVLFADLVIAVAGPGLDPSGKAAAAEYLRLVSPVAFVMAVSAVLFAVCQAEDLFPSIALSVAVGPVVTLAIMLALWDRFGLEALALGSLFGPIVSLLVLVLAAARHRALPSPRLFARGVGLPALARHALPLTISASILQLNTIIDRAIASLVAPGAISALRYGDSLVRAPIAAIGPAWGNAIYPALVRATHGEGGGALGPAANRTLRATIAALVPVSLLTVAVAPVAVGVVYGRGSFGADDVLLVGQVLAGFAPLIAFLMIQQVVVSALNAQRKGLILLGAGVLHVVLNALFDVVLGFSLGVVGIALSSTLTVAIVVLFQGEGLRRTGIELAPSSLLVDGVRAVVASLPATLVVAVLAWSGLVPTDALRGVLALVLFGAGGLVVYVAVAARSGYREPVVIAQALTQRVGRLAGRARRPRGSSAGPSWPAPAATQETPPSPETRRRQAAAPLDDATRRPADDDPRVGDLHPPPPDSKERPRA